MNPWFSPSCHMGSRGLKNESCFSIYPTGFSVSVDPLEHENETMTNSRNKYLIGGMEGNARVWRCVRPTG